MLDFVVGGDATIAPPGLGAWAAENTASYLSPPFELAGRGEVNWYMGRLGVTLHAAIVDPFARLYLGRAIDVRYVVIGSVDANSAGLKVVAHLLDTETGTQVATASAVAHDRTELKGQIGDVSRRLLVDSAERRRREAGAAEAMTILSQAESAAKESNFTLAIDLAKKAAQKSPGIQTDLLLEELDRRSRNAAWEAQRRAGWQQEQAGAEAAARRQQALAKAAEAARTAAQQAGAVNADERRRRRDLACQQLAAQARAAMTAQNYGLALQLCDSALALDRRADVAGEQAKAKARVEEQARVRVSIETTTRDVAKRQERLAEIARAQARLDADGRQRAAAEQARRNAQDQADVRESARLVEEARRFRARANSTRPCGRCKPQSGCMRQTNWAAF